MNLPYEIHLFALVIYFKNKNKFPELFLYNCSQTMHAKLFDS